MSTAPAIDPQFVEKLRCPQNRMKLRVAEGSLLASVNRAIAAGEVLTAGGHAVDEPLEGGLVREDGQVLYPILQGIPRLLIDEAIPLGAGERGA